jgi:hypothetical protein
MPTMSFDTLGKMEVDAHNVKDTKLEDELMICHIRLAHLTFEESSRWPKMETYTQSKCHSRTVKPPRFHGKKRGIKNLT